MKKKLIASMVCMAALVVAGCGQGTAPKQEAKEPAKTEKTETAKLSGTVSISGSTSTEKVVKALADEFKAKNPGVEVTYEGIGSSAGVKNAISGVSNIGTASREIKAEEKSQGIDELAFAYDGIAAIVHPSNKVADISMEQLKQIYAGEITNWSELGGADGAIVVVSREEGSGTRGAFEELLKLEKIAPSATIAEGNGNVQTTVAGNPNAIGYVSFTYLDGSVKDLTVAGVKADPAKVISGDYKLSRPFNMVFFKDKLNEQTKAFLDYIQSDEAKPVIEEAGAIVE